jgi:hypothetical protein
VKSAQNECPVSDFLTGRLNVADSGSACGQCPFRGDET